RTGHPGGGRHEREVALVRAPGSAQPPDAKAADLRVVVGVAAADVRRRGARVRTPLDHAEGNGRPWKCVPRAPAGAEVPGTRLGAIERIDVARQIGRRARLAGRHARRQREHHPDGAPPAPHRAGYLSSYSPAAAPENRRLLPSPAGETRRGPGYGPQRPPRLRSRPAAI